MDVERNPSRPPFSNLILSDRSMSIYPSSIPPLYQISILPYL